MAKALLEKEIEFDWVQLPDPTTLLLNLPFAYQLFDWPRESIYCRIQPGHSGA
jgi:hypothetical protein